MEDDLNKIKNGRQPPFFLKNQNDDLKKRKMTQKKCKRTSTKKCKIYSNKKWKITSKKMKQNGKQPKINKKWNTISKNKMEDEAINQNQPNWL